YFEKWGNSDILEARYSGPGISKQIIPSSVLFQPSTTQNSTSATLNSNTMSNGNDGGFEEAATFEASTAYPNPFSNELNISLAQDGYEGIVSLALVDLSGKLILTKEVDADGYDLNFSAADLNIPSGIYFLQIVKGTKKEVIK